jgi:hypothetical protein
MFISDPILKSLADDFARERCGRGGARRRLRRTRTWRLSKLTRVPQTRDSSAATVPAERN